MDYRQTLEYLFGMLPMFQRVGAAAFKKDLSNTIRLCKALDYPHLKFPSVHVAGTNGKGSSSHTLASILQAAGYKTGLYTSPHLKDFTERIRINGACIPQPEVVAWVEQHRGLIEEIKPSFFELTVGMAFDWFAREQVDIAIIETGMGGRLDSTNVIHPLVSLITRIGLDHVAFLGDTLPLIAREKAGIIKPQVPVVISQRQPAVEGVFLETARQQNAPLVFAEEHYHAHWQPSGLLHITQQDSPWLAAQPTDLKAHYYAANLPGVLAVIDQLNQLNYVIPKEAVAEGIASVCQKTGLKGRWQVLDQHPLTVADVSHNPDGMEHLMLQVANTPHQQLHIVLGMVADKDVSNTLSALPKGAFYYFCQADIPRALAAAALAEKAQEYQLKGVVVAEVNEALALARRKAAADDMILVTGSTFVVADLENL
ncbi:bifunctional folylpolyglutamate synthase/dihydrofolate synthase [Cesiribacter andamanensis]|uniref:Dihydrofolate synthase/folylpolyglutamate synthase n=1 Tax=Cesiribacter andamanensis AMV16 TaxID=1279009 RepID=M7NM77_9BACT|nr:folylpolyglutamate synthase/dihydrofolate synthase family protein [Cesiribacter andamanensis]EMR02885.1 Bifunctional protein folC [Cesiribacter andamanensis AMV16]